MDSHHATQEFCAILNEHKLIPTIMKLTRVTHSTASVIDNICLKYPTIVNHESFVLIDGMSDHYPCLLSCELMGVCKDRSMILVEKRKVTEAKLDKIQRDLLFTDWSRLVEIDVNDGYNFLISAITKVLDIHVPKKLIKIRECDKFREPWMTVKIRNYNARCRKLCNKARISGKESDFRKYKQYRNILNRLKVFEKRNHYDDLFTKIGKNSQLLWNVLNNLMRKTSNKNDITELLYNGENLVNDQNICDTFNMHFATVGERIKDTVPNVNINPMKYMRRFTNCMLFSPISEQYICKLVSDLKPKTSSRYDDISNRLLKQLVNVLKLPLSIIFNKSLMNGEYPDLMKLVKVSPLHKSGGRNIPDNFRPISLLPVLSKILERIVFNFMVKHLDNNILYSRQYGFRQNHLTTDGIMNLVGEVLKALDDKFMVLNIFIDLRKAFDTVPHKIILDKLQCLGLQGRELEWFESYMSKRRQFVSVNGTRSREMRLNVGVQQGSLLGVLLFQLLINDLSSSLKFCRSVLYADDTTLFVMGHSLRYMKIKMQYDLNVRHDWLCANGLKLNVSKTKAMVFNREGLRLTTDLSTDGEKIDFVFSFKFLGLVLDIGLTFAPHFVELYQKLLQLHFVICKLTNILPIVCL